MGIYTWGQLRLQIQQSVPGLTLDKTDEFLTTRYAYVLDRTRWFWLEQRAYVETQAPYRSTTDTVNVTQGSASIVGVGTNWTSTLNGLKFQVNADGPFYVFMFVDATHATLDRVYEGSTNTGLGYSLFQNVYALPSDCKRVIEVESADDGFRLDELSEAQMGDSVGFRDEIGNPSVYAITPSPESLDGGTTWQIEFFPIPMYAKGYPVRYEREANAFTGSNTGTYPLPFVTDRVLLTGARADAWLDAADLNKAKGYELQFQEELGNMIRAARRQMASAPLKPARRYTRHRLQRLLRNTFPRIPN
jgi:hypothetical protein